MNILSIDTHISDGKHGRDFTGDDYSSAEFHAYCAGREMSGNPVNMTTWSNQDGASHRCDSLHPANFKADA